MRIPNASPSTISARPNHERYSRDLGAFFRVGKTTNVKKQRNVFELQRIGRVRFRYVWQRPGAQPYRTAWLLCFNAVGLRMVQRNLVVHWFPRMVFLYGYGVWPNRMSLVWVAQLIVRPINNEPN